MSQHQISRQLNISCKCIRQTIGKSDKFHIIAVKSGAGRTPKMIECQKRLVTLQRGPDNTLPLIDIVRFASIDLNLTISRQTVRRILHDFDMISSIVSKRPRITTTQKRT